MKTNSVSKKWAYFGAGVGVVLFAIFGLLPGSFLGGVMGLNIAGKLFGYPVEPGVVPRIILAISMLIGVMAAGIMFIVGFSTLGWLLGTVVNIVTGKKKAIEAEETAKKIP
ncbi:MAG: hypothetical protein HZA07_07455 [Nitrospirae bacterium]|nr:hypothetical protein [Nitrospirota bacterium]